MHSQTDGGWMLLGAMEWGREKGNGGGGRSQVEATHISRVWEVLGSFMPVQSTTAGHVDVTLRICGTDFCVDSCPQLEGIPPERERIAAQGSLQDILSRSGVMPSSWGQELTIQKSVPQIRGVRISATRRWCHCLSFSIDSYSGGQSIGRSRPVEWWWWAVERVS